MANCQPSLRTTSQSKLSLIKGLFVFTFFGIWFIYIGIQKGTFCSKFDSKTPIFFEVKSVDKIGVLIPDYFANGYLKGTTKLIQTSIFRDDFYDLKKKHTLIVFLMKNHPDVVITTAKYNECKPIVSFLGVSFSWHLWFGFLIIVIISIIQIGLFNAFKRPQIVNGSDLFLPLKPKFISIGLIEDKLIIKYIRPSWLTLLIFGICSCLIAASIYYSFFVIKFISIILLVFLCIIVFSILKRPSLSLSRDGTIIFSWKLFFLNRKIEFNQSNWDIIIKEKFETDGDNSYNFEIIDLQNDKRYKVFNAGKLNEAIYIKNEITKYLNREI
jgi:hypothetical protein